MTSIRTASQTARPGDPQLWPCTGEYPVYDAFLYHVMTRDEARNSLFEAALASCAADQHVIDVGAGADLNWARAALRHGARLATAIEALPETLEAARRRWVQELGAGR